MGQRTPLYQQHLQAKAKMVDFGGWDMPLHYGSQKEEHLCVRDHAGMFDVSHMAIVDVQGAQAQAFLQYVLANDVAKLSTVGKALYATLLNHEGGVLDDLIVYYREPDYYRLVVNAATQVKDLNWLNQQSQAFKVQIKQLENFSILAIQGPKACLIIEKLLANEALSNLKPFTSITIKEWFFARTGYTGEAGFEIMLPANECVAFWQKLLDAGVRPCGLGSRDTLRLEAGMSLYGQDLDESVTPLESGLEWTVAWSPVERDFIGRTALERQRSDGLQQRQVGLVLQGRGVPRHGQKVILADGFEGIITSGTVSPTLGNGIAMARIALNVKEERVPTTCQIEIRNKHIPAQIVQLPFVRKGVKTFTLVK